MAKSKYTREEISEAIEKFKAGNLSRTNLTVDFMDAYVAKFQQDKINEWIVQCLQTELGKRQNEFTYLNSLTASQIASLKDHASAVVTLEAYIRWLKEMIEKYGGRFNGNF